MWAPPTDAPVVHWRRDTSLMTDGGNSVERVRAALQEAGHPDTIEAFPDGTRRAQDAAAAVGCTVAQIAKSIVLRAGRIARHIVPLLGKRPLKHLTSAGIRRFLEAVMSGKPAATVKAKPRGLVRVTGGPTAAGHAVGLLGGMYSYATEVGYIEHNPAHGIRKPADKRRASD